MEENNRLKELLIKANKEHKARKDELHRIQRAGSDMALQINELEASLRKAKASERAARQECTEYDDTFGHMATELQESQDQLTELKKSIELTA